MGLKKFSGVHTVVDLHRDVRQTVDPPMLTIYNPARTIFSVLALGLLGLTAITADETRKAVRQAAAALDENDEAPWSADDARQILIAAGSLPNPANIQVTRVDGDGVLLIRTGTDKTPKARAVNYKSGRPTISLLAAIREEQIVIPKGKALEVPVKLAEDDNGLALAVYLRKGKLRNASEGESAGSTTTSETKQEA